ncbi:MAG: 5-formyltetrahydrofolate cyclo-ligase, partial [Clostridia bacterium]|nr:5-formyltetrahydrofolate cyclo-ligase [Clostridia bacterium]
MTNGKLRFVEKQETDVWQRKKDMRLRMKRRRSDNENRDVKENLLIENVLRLLEPDLSKISGAGTRLNVMVYLSFSSEARTDKLIETLQKQGATVYAPRVENKEITAVAIGEDYTLSAWGIREPVGETYDGEMDVVITPLLAADTQGNRLGYGGGYYDRFFNKDTNARRVGYCYDFQVLQNVPHTDSDQRLQYIITDKRIIVCTDKT